MYPQVHSNHLWEILDQINLELNRKNFALDPIDLQEDNLLKK